MSPHLFRSAAFFFLAVCCLTGPALAQQTPESPSDTAAESAVDEADEAGWRELEPTVVTATPIPQPKSTLGVSSTVITAEQLEAQRIVDLPDALRLAPGVTIAQNGGRGALSSLFLRGGDSDHTLVLIDGVAINQIGGTIDLGAISIDNIERIEVIRGAQSALYGAEAMSGVINIITKRGEGPPQWRYDLSAGTRDTVRAVGSVSGSTDRAYYSASVSRDQTSNRGGLRHDDFEHYTLSGRTGIRLDDNLELDGSFRYERDFIENPRVEGGLPVDLDDESDDRRVIATGAATHHITDTWQHRIKFSLYDEDGHNSDDSPQGPLFADFVTDRTTRVERHTVDYRHSVTFWEDHILTVGGELQEEEGESNDPLAFTPVTERRLLNRAGYVQLQSSFLDETLNVQAGVRYDNNSGFGEETSPRVAASYLVRATGTRLHAGYGEGIKTPNIFEFAANRNLNAERSEHWDVGIEQTVLDDRIVVDVTYFEQDIEDLVDFVIVPPFTLVSFNLDEAETSGIEASATARIRDDLTGSLAYTFLETEDKQTGSDLLRRPKHSAHGSLTYDPGRWRATVAAHYGDESSDVIFLPPTFAQTKVTNDDYVLLNLTGAYDVNDRVEVYGLIENLLDDEYETAATFPANGITVLFGVRGVL